MANYPAFMICENPMADEQHGHRVFVLYSRSPVILAWAEHLDISDEYEVPQVGSVTTHDDERIVLHALLATKDAEHNVLAKIMRRMADWYKAYLQWEDEQGE